MRMIRVVAGLALVMAMVPVARAVEPSPMPARAAYECAENYHDMITAFHLAAFSPKDGNASANFDAAIKRADQCATDLGSLASDARLPAVVSMVSNGRKRVIELAQYNAAELARRGAGDLQAVTAMSQDALAARKLAVDIKYINARYTERSTEVILRADTGEKTIDVLTIDFERSLTALLKKTKPNSPAHAELRSIETRINFLRGSLINYNQNEVMFTVNFHVGKISGQLRKLADAKEGIKTS